MDCFIKQLKNDDCGFTCLKMMLAYKSKNKEYLFLKQENNKSPYSLRELMTIARKHGLEIQGLKIADESKEYDFGKDPFLAVFKTPNGVGHMVFVRKVRRNKFLIFDPKNGKYWMKKERFLEKWAGIVMTVLYYKKKKFKSENLTIFKRKGIIIGNAIKSLSSIFLMVGFYFINENSYYIIPLIFVTVFVLLVIIGNAIIKRSSYNFDKNISNYIYSSDNKDFLGKYKDLLKYKAMIFVSPSELITNSLTALFFVLITSINNYKNAFFFAILIGITIIDFIIFNNVKRKYSSLLEETEEKLSREDISQEEFTRNYSFMTKMSNKFAGIVLFRKYFVTFLIFVLTFTLMAISKQISLNYLIFHFLIYQLVYQSSNKVIEYIGNNEESKKLKATFVSLLNRSK